MPYTRKSRAPMRRKRKTYPRRKASLATQVKAIVNRTAEKKIKSGTWDETALSTLSQGSFYDPMAIEQGVGRYQRIGDQVRLQGLHIKGVVRNNGSNANYVKMIVFYAKDQANMSSAEDIFEQPSGDGATFSSVTGLNTIYTAFNKSLITVISSKVFKLSAADAVDGSDTRLFSKFIKLKDRLVRYEFSGTGANNCSPRLHIGWWAAESPDDTTTGQTVELSGLFRLFYTDV